LENKLGPKKLLKTFIKQKKASGNIVEVLFISFKNKI
jgi:hypothetical protein